MHNRRRLKLAGLGLLVGWLVTGGFVCVDSQWRYVHDYNRNYRPWLRVEVARHERTRGIPFLFTHMADVPPFDADFVYYTQDLVQGAELSIDRLAVRYPDGTEADLTHEVAGRLPAEPYEMWYVEDHVQLKRPALRATWQVRKCIAQSGPFTLLVAGQLRKGEQVLERFDTSLRCTPFGEMHFYPKWFRAFQLWAGASC